MALLEDEKIFITERFHEPPPDKFELPHLPGFNPKYYGPNKNMKDFLTDSAQVNLKNEEVTLVKNGQYAFCR